MENKFNIKNCNLDKLSANIKTSIAKTKSNALYNIHFLIQYMASILIINTNTTHT